MLIRVSLPCERCGKEAIVYQPYSGNHLCAQHFVLDFERRAKHEIRRHRWVRSGDRIAIAMSGGKDSSALAYFMRRTFGRRRDLSLFAVSVDEGIAGYRDMERIRALAEGLGLEWHSTSFRAEFGRTLEEILRLKGEHLSCSCCGVLRRRALNRLARETGATKLAMGFNLDDEAQSVLMNLLRGDAARLLRRGLEGAGFVPRVKPFRMIPEREVALYAMLHVEGFEQRRCPYAKNAMRNEVRAMLNGYAYRHPATKFSLLRLAEELGALCAQEEGEGSACPSCGEMGSGLCRVCRMLAELEACDRSTREREGEEGGGS